MIDNTVLVVDADQENQEKIVSTLKTEGYQVFTASGQDISAGMADKINPSLIYLQATSSTIQVCKKINTIEKFKKVPIILLASLSETLEIQAYFDSIVDYLKMPVSLHELVEKTGEILGRASDFKETEEAKGFMKKETVPAEEPLESLLKKSMRKRPYSSGLLTPFLVVIAAIVILAAGFFIYKSFISKPEIPVSVAVKPQKTVQHQEPTVLLPQGQQKQEQPVAEEKPAVKNEVPKVAPEAVAPYEEEKPAVKNEAPKETPGVDAPDSKVAEKPFYSVQLGAFRIEANAEELAKTYKEKGYEVFIHEITAKDNKILYMVLIDKFENSKEASQLAENIRSKEKIETTVFRGKTK